MNPPADSVTVLLHDIEDLLNKGPDEEATNEILRIISVPMPGNGLLHDPRIYSEYLPKNGDCSSHRKNATSIFSGTPSTAPPSPSLSTSRSPFVA